MWAEEKLRKAFISYGNSNDFQIHEAVFEGFYETEEDKKEILDFVKRNRFLFYSKVSPDVALKSNEATDLIYYNGNSFVSVDFDNGVAGVFVQSYLPIVLKKFHDFLKTKLVKRKKENQGKAHVLVQTQEGLTTRELGVVGVPFNIDNYTESERSSIEEIIKDLKSPIPFGKLTILQGPPGAGKTFLIRSLITEIPNAFFVIVPPTLVSHLGDPQVIPTLLAMKEDKYIYKENFGDQDQRKEKNAGPVVLIVEDADECLVDRNKTHNTSTISTILNLTSGILGDLLDVRIIATTNAEFEEFDKALTRDGRLSYNVKIGEITHEEACKIFKRILQDEDAVFENPNGEGNKVLLATVYNEAKKKGYRPVSSDVASRTNVDATPKRKIGFF